MRRFILNCLLFVAIFVVCDFIAGKAINILANKSVSGQVLKNHEIAETITPDVLILGSSRSTHHYVPYMMADSLGRSVYVAGQDGNGILMMWPVMRLISDRHKPELVIYDLTPAFDVVEDSPQKYLRYLRPLWNRNSAVDSIISEIDPAEPLKLNLSTYRYNSMAPSILSGLRPGEVYRDGYIPLYGDFATGNEANTAMGDTVAVSPLKLKFFDDMMTYAWRNGIEMLFVYSPHYSPAPDHSLDDLGALIRRNGFTLIDYSGNNDFVLNKELFRDPDHLNHSGAEKFTEQIISILKDNQ